MGAFSDPVMWLVSWLLTYALHSTLLLGLVWAADFFLKKNRSGLREVVWKAALVGGLMTATLQTGLNLKPLAGSWSLTSETVGPVVPALVESTPRPVSDRVAVLEAFQESPIPAPALAGVEVPSADSFLSKAISVWPQLALASWILIAGCLFCGLVFSYVMLHLRLRDRKQAQGELPLILARIISGSGMTRRIMLSISGRLESPIAMGLFKPQIIAPNRVRDLNVDQQETMLAHEVAHIIHGDPFWLLFSRTLECLFFFQPLNRLARLRLQELAEYRCDDWAANHTGNPLALAKCLTEVAQWRLGESPRYPVPGMAAKRSELGVRVRRLVAQDRNLNPRNSTPRALISVVCAVLALVAFAVPGFRGRADVEVAPMPQYNAELVEFNLETLPKPATPPASPKPNVAAAPPSQFRKPITALKPVAEVAGAAVAAPRAQPSAFESVSPESAPQAWDIKTKPLPEPAPSSRLALTPVVSSISHEDRVDALESKWESQLEAFAVEFEQTVERFEDELDRVVDHAEDKMEKNLWRRMREDAIEEKFDVFEDEADDILDHIEERLDAIEDQFDDALNNLTPQQMEHVSDMEKALEVSLKQWRKEYQSEMGKLEKKLARLKRKYA